METEIASPPGNAESGSAGSRDPALPVATGPRRWWWLLAVLVACVSLIVGGSVQHAVDQRNAARDLYGTPVLTTLWRFMHAERGLVALPVAQRSDSAIVDLADAINADQGVNGSGTLNVSVDSGSAAQPAQAAYSVTVASPYASTTVAVWYIYVSGPGGAGDNEGACVLWSTLLGPGRATSFLNLRGGEGLQPCSPQWWSPGPMDATQPRLSLAGIPQSPG